MKLLSSSRRAVLAAVLTVLVLCSASRVQSVDFMYKVQVLAPANGLRVQTDVPGGVVASFGGNGAFQVDAPGVPGGRFAVTEDGRVGITTANPSSRLHVRAPASSNPISGMFVAVDSFSTPGNSLASTFFRARDIGANGPSAFMIRGDGHVGIGTDGPSDVLTVAGMVQSTSGGLKFPDGTVQSTAAPAAGSTYTKPCINPIYIGYAAQSICHLNLPSASYLLLATIEVYDYANDVFSGNNSRDVVCYFGGDNSFAHTLAGSTQTAITMHAVLTVASGIDVYCWGTLNDGILVQSRRLTATQLTAGAVGQ